MPDSPAQPDEGAWSDYLQHYRDIARQLTAPDAEVTPRQVEKVDNYRVSSERIPFGKVGREIVRALEQAERQHDPTTRCPAKGCTQGASGVYLDYCRVHGELALEHDLAVLDEDQDVHFHRDERAACPHCSAQL